MGGGVTPERGGKRERERERGSGKLQTAAQRERERENPGAFESAVFARDAPQH